VRVTLSCRVGDVAVMGSSAWELRCRLSGCSRKGFDDEIGGGRDHLVGLEELSVWRDRYRTGTDIG
jgi:hypothetical protein